MKTLQELTLFDRFPFNETMEIPEAHEAVLRIILGDEKLKLLSQVQTEKEMQTAPFDLFGKGKYCYTFRPYCEEDPSLMLDDGAVRIFLNSHGTNREEVSEELIALLEYMETMDEAKVAFSNSEKLRTLHGYVKQIKASEEIGVKYMQKWEEMAEEREEARAEGLEEGREEGSAVKEVSILRRLLQEKQRDEEVVADDLDLSLEYVQQVKGLFQKYPMETDAEIVRRIQGCVK